MTAESDQKWLGITYSSYHLYKKSVVHVLSQFPCLPLSDVHSSPSVHPFVSTMLHCHLLSGSSGVLVGIAKEMVGGGCRRGRDKN